MCLAEYLDWRRYFDDWVTVCRAAREAAHRSGDREGEAIAWNNLGVALRAAGRVAEAIDAHTRARDLYQAAGDRHREASAWNNLGIALREAGRAEEAIEAHTRARDLYQATGTATARPMRGTTSASLCGRRGGRRRRSRPTPAPATCSRPPGTATARPWRGTTSASPCGRRAGRRRRSRAHGKALEIYREFEDWYGTGPLSHNLALAHKAAQLPRRGPRPLPPGRRRLHPSRRPAEAAEARTLAEEQALPPRPLTPPPPNPEPPTPRQHSPHPSPTPRLPSLPEPPLPTAPPHHAPQNPKRIPPPLIASRSQPGMHMPPMPVIKHHLQLPLPPPQRQIHRPIRTEPKSTSGQLPHHLHRNVRHLLQPMRLENNPSSSPGNPRTHRLGRQSEAVDKRAPGRTGARLGHRSRRDRPRTAGDADMANSLAGQRT